MISGADDLIATITSDVAMVAGIVALYGLLRRGLRQMVAEEIGKQVQAQVETELAPPPGQTVAQASRAEHDRVAGLVARCEELARQYGELRQEYERLDGQFIAHLNRRGERS